MLFFVFQAGSNLFLNGMVLATIYMGGFMMSAGTLTGGDLMAFLVAVQILQRSFTQISVLFGTYIKGKHAGARVFEVRIHGFLKKFSIFWYYLLVLPERFLFSLQSSRNRRH